MRVLIAAPRGFCAGVEMAVRGLNRVLEHFGPPVYCYHEVVHNQTVVADFEERGVVFVDSVEKVPLGAQLAFSAHGVSPEIRATAAQRNLHVIDLTCPLVAKVHREARVFAAQGRSIALIGHADHDEVMGVLGEASEHLVLIEKIEDVQALHSDGHNGIAYLTQTTLSVDDTREIIHELKRRFPEIKGPAIEDICYATQNRQEAIRQLSRVSELVLVIGSANSFNTRNLVETAVREGRRAYRIGHSSDIRVEWLNGVETVVLTAGASVPETLVQEVAAYLHDRWNAQVEESILRTEAMHFAIPSVL